MGRLRPGFELLSRYETPYTRAYHKALADLMKLRDHRQKAAERVQKDEEKAQIGFERQNQAAAAQAIRSEQHEMKKQRHKLELLTLSAARRHNEAVSVQTAG